MNSRVVAFRVVLKAHINKNDIFFEWCIVSSKLVRLCHKNSS